MHLKVCHHQLNTSVSVVSSGFSVSYCCTSLFNLNKLLTHVLHHLFTGSVAYVEQAMPFPKDGKQVSYS